MEYNIPLFDLNFDEAEEKAVIDTLRSKWISTGPKCELLEKNFAKMLNAKFALTLSNCTTALHLALKILGIKDGDEVIVPSLTFVATVNAVKYVNATPVFCDVLSTEELTIDPQMIKQLLTSKTKAIIPMHYAGFPCKMKEILQIAKENNLFIVEDACHGPLSEYGGDKLGTIGDIGCFSFFSNKNISTGEGGMLVTDSEEIFNKAGLLRSHGMTTLSYERSKGHSTTYDVINLGYNYRMDDIRASIGLVQLTKLQSDIRKRSELRKYYLTKLSGEDKIILPFSNYSGNYSHYIFPIVLKNSNYEKRAAVRKYLQKKGIQTSVHYPAVHRFSIYKDYFASLPVTDYVANNEITLPIYSNLGFDKIDYIVESLKAALS
jgi:dTDP-4-amino-4,6-dideoxygalactose transaminase